MGMIMVAFNAIGSIAVAEAKAEDSLATNCLPLFPVGTLKVFNLQWVL